MSNLNQLYEQRNALPDKYTVEQQRNQINLEIINAEHDEIMRLGKLAAERGLAPRVVAEFNFDLGGPYIPSRPSLELKWVVLTNEGTRVVNALEGDSFYKTIMGNKGEIIAQLTAGTISESDYIRLMKDKDRHEDLVLEQIAAGNTYEFTNESLDGVRPVLDVSVKRYRSVRESVEKIVSE